MVGNKNNNLNFVFLGTPEVASKTLDILKENGYLPSLIITGLDKPVGRKMIITPPPVKIWAIENNIPYLQPEKINDETIRNILGTLGRSDGDGQRKFSAENFRGEQNIPDCFVVVAYGKILPEEFIKIPKLGTINIHYSLLPKYRGASPLEQALLNGDTKTGVSIQQMEYKLDSGPIIAEQEVEIGIDETKEELRERLIEIGGNLLVKNLPNIISGNLNLKNQNEAEATFCKKIKKEYGLVDLNDDPKNLYNKYRAYSGWPGIYYFKDNIRIKITKARYENNSFIIERVVPEGKKEMDYKN